MDKNVFDSQPEGLGVAFFAHGPGLGLIMYILTTLEFPKHYFDFHKIKQGYCFHFRVEFTAAGAPCGDSHVVVNKPLLSASMKFASNILAAVRALYFPCTYRTLVLQ